MSVSFSRNIYFGRAFLPLANLKKVIWNRSFRSLKKWSSSLSVHFFWKKWSRSVQFSDLDHWTDLARSIQPYSGYFWVWSNSQLEKNCIHSSVSLSIKYIKIERHYKKLFKCYHWFVSIYFDLMLSRTSCFDIAMLR